MLRLSSAPLHVIILHRPSSLLMPTQPSRALYPYQSSINPPPMAADDNKLLSFLAVLLLLTFFSSSGAADELVASSAEAEFIRSSCAATRYPSVCVESLSSYAAAVRCDPRQLAASALSVSSDRARDASAYVRSRLPAAALRLEGGGSVRDCADEMADSVDRLRSSVRQMAALGPAGGPEFGWYVSNVLTWVSAALTDENTCLDGLDGDVGGDGVTRAAIRKRVVGVAEVTTVALAFVNRIASSD